jgi:hypothetical protein
MSVKVNTVTGSTPVANSSINSLFMKYCRCLYCENQREIHEVIMQATGEEDLLVGDYGYVDYIPKTTIVEDSKFKFIGWATIWLGANALDDHTCESTAENFVNRMLNYDLDAYHEDWVTLDTFNERLYYPTGVAFLVGFGFLYRYFVPVFRIK